MKKKLNFIIVLLCIFTIIPMKSFALGIRESEAVTLEKCINKHVKILKI